MPSKYNYDEKAMKRRGQASLAAGCHNDMILAQRSIRHLLDRVHIGTSYLGAVRAVLGMMPGGWPAVRKICADRAHRRQFIRICLYIHQQNRQLYTDAMFLRPKR